jgi:cysteine sulfinate desulfinase/cysteine desulfurase-like protein
MIYLDHAAATPVDGEVLAAMQPYFSDAFYNPSATYLPARQVREDLEAARARVAHWLGVRPTEVIFTAGGTEGNNLAIARHYGAFSKLLRYGKRHRARIGARSGAAVQLHRCGYNRAG